MKHFVATLCAAGMLSLPAMAAPVTYAFDKEHTNIAFYVDHLGYSEMLGIFRDFDGSFVFDKEKPEASHVEITLKPAGIETSSKVLDEHLQGKDWFNAAKYPALSFKSSKVKVTGKNTAEVTGWLNMLGKEKAVTMNVTLNGTGEHPMSKKQVAGFTGDAALKRSDWGMNNGIPMVSDKVRLHFSTEGNAVESGIKKSNDGE